MSSHNFCCILALQCKLGLWKIGNHSNDKVRWSLGGRPFSANTNLSPPPLPPRGTPLILAKTFSGETIGRTKICIKYDFRYSLDLHFLIYKIFVSLILRILSLKNLLLSIFLFWNFGQKELKKVCMHEIKIEEKVHVWYTEKISAQSDEGFRSFRHLETAESYI